jgi:diguanylate cyclase (GGDEF)-like protein/PAS domain S-box-containing protein
MHEVSSLSRAAVAWSGAAKAVSPGFYNYDPSCRPRNIPAARPPAPMRAGMVAQASGGAGRRKNTLARFALPRLGRIRRLQSAMAAPPESAPVRARPLRGLRAHIVLALAALSLLLVLGMAWIVLLTMEGLPRFGPTETTGWGMLAGGALLAVISVAAGWMMTRRLAIPVETMTANAQRIAAGDHALEFDNISSIREMHELAAALGGMVSVLSAQRAAVEENNRALEGRIAERTHELSSVSAELEATNERLSFALAGSKTAIFDCDVETGMVHLNAEWGKMLGAEPVDVEVHYRELMEWVPAEEREGLAALQARVLKGETDSYEAEHRVRRRDGGLIWIRSRGRVTLRAPNGRALRFSGTNTDITETVQRDAALLESEAMLRLVTDNAPVMICQMDQNLRYRFANKAYLDFFGVDERSILGKTIAEVAGEEAQRTAVANLAELRAGRATRHTRRRRARDGSMRDIEVRQVPHFSPEGAFRGYVFVADDMTKRNAFEQSLADSAAQLRALADHVPAAICHVDMGGKLLYANQRYCNFWGIAQSAAAGLNIADVAGDAEKAAFEAHIGALANGQDVTYERDLTASDQGRLHVEVRLVPRRTGAGPVRSAYMMIDDVTVRKEVESKLLHQALTDPLTGLPNKRLFSDRLERAISEARRDGSQVALLFADLDEFKPVNDRLGHATGDILLKEVAARMLACVRASDTVARLGGDEFVVLLRDANSRHDCENVAKKILASLSQPFALPAAAGADPAARATISVSVGMCMFPDHGQDAEFLLQNADQAMYLAKGRGKNRHAWPASG